jgi:ADP-ribose pyrophosphatase YjhB (NUDIX family)
VPDPDWLAWARRLHAIARGGLTYSDNPFEIERLHQVQTVANEMLAAGTGAPVAEIAAFFDREEGYATPKVDVRGVVFQEDRILLVKERVDGGWTLPGGWADVGDSPAEAVTREVYEESGYHTRPVRLMAVYDRSHPRHGHPPHIYHIYKLFIECELLGGEPVRANAEIDGVGWFEQDSVLPLSLGRTTPSQIARLFELHQHPEWPADFD